MWLSLGPMPIDGEARVSGFGLYGVLYHYVPGFNGVRVPARYAMIAGLFLAVLAGYGDPCAFSILPNPDLHVANADRIGRVRVLILLEGAAIPMEINRTWNQNEAMPPARVYPGAEPEPPRPSTPASPRCRPAPSSPNFRSAIGVGNPLRLLRRRALETDHQWLQRRFPAAL